MRAASDAPEAEGRHPVASASDAPEADRPTSGCEPKAMHLRPKADIWLRAEGDALEAEGVTGISREGNDDGGVRTGDTAHSENSCCYPFNLLPN